jgi:hypothetical protein
MDKTCREIEIFVGKSETSDNLGNEGVVWENCIKMGLRDVVCEAMDENNPGHDIAQL